MENILRGLSPALMTPFASDTSVDLDELVAHAKRVIQAGCTSVTWPGTMGDWSEVERDERDEGVRRLAAEVPLIVGTGAQRTEHAEHHADVAAQAGARALMVIPRLLNGRDWPNQLEHFVRVATAGNGIPALVYNNFLYGFQMTPQQFFELRERAPSYVGFKEAGGSEALRLAGQQMAHAEGCVLGIGADPNVFDGVIHFGGRFCIAGVANFLPTQCLRLWELCELARDRPTPQIQRWADELNSALMELFLLDIKPELVAWYKCGMTCAGFKGYERHRPSWKGLTTEQTAWFRGIYERFIRWWSNWDGQTG